MQEIEKSQLRERTLNALLRTSLRATSLDEQLQQALDVILATPWLPLLRQGAIFLLGDEPGTLKLQASRGLDPAMVAACSRVGFGRCMCGRAIASGEVQFAGCVDQRHEIHHAGMPPHGHYSVPLLFGDQAIGILALYLAEGHRRDPQEEEFLQAVADTLAGLIVRKQAEAQRDAMLEALAHREQQLEDYSHNLERRVQARTHEIEQRRQVAEGLRSILAMLNSDRPLDEILSYIVAQAGQLLGGDSSAIYRLPGSEASLHLQTARCNSVGLLAELALPADLHQALLAGQPVIACDVVAALPGEPAAVPATEEPGAGPAGCRHTLLALPLLVGGKVYGCLAIYYTEAHTFGDEEVGLAAAFADQAALALENAQLQQQARDAAVLEERARLARDLHDSVTQQLYSLTLLAEGWRRLAAAGQLGDVDQPLAEVGQIARQALKEMRLLVYELRPPDLEQAGLLAVLGERLAAIERRAGVKANLLSDLSEDLPMPTQEGLYYIAAEALNNALKHGDAASVTVRLRGDGEWLEMEVTDDGHGFDQGAAAIGLGLKTMRERAEKLGGVLAIHSAPGAGTRVTVSLGKGKTVDG